jgi:PAS domain S-box-containing protein
MQEIGVRHDRGRAVRATHCTESAMTAGRQDKPRTAARRLAKPIAGSDALDGVLAALVLQNTQEGVVVTDRANRIVSVNRAFCEITGYDAGEVLGRNPRLLASGLQTTAFYQRMWQAIHDRGAWQGELWDRRKNGELNAELERRVAERTAALKQANVELAAFSYAVSHDLRAPLRVIDHCGEQLAHDCAGLIDAQGLAHLQRIRGNTARMFELIDDLLRLAHLQHDALDRQDVDLSALAREIARGLAQGDPQRRVTVTIAPHLCAHGDARLLRILLENLLGNAWKFTARRDAATITVGGAPRGDGASAFFVADDGAGFDMDHAARLFRPFHRLHAASDFPGNGIGLATAQRIVARHGGRIWAEGAPGKGATFSFTLRGAPADAA